MNVNVAEFLHNDKDGISAYENADPDDEIGLMKVNDGHYILAKKENN